MSSCNSRFSAVKAGILVHPPTKPPDPPTLLLREWVIKKSYDIFRLWGADGAGGQAGGKGTGVSR